MKCKYPIQSSFLVFLWIVLLPAVTLTHIGISKMIPAIADLPKNIVKGFDVTFKFAVLESTVKDVKDSSAAAVNKCGVDASTICIESTPVLPPGIRSVTKDVSVEKNYIVDKWTTSLKIVDKVASDKFFGIEDLESTKNDLAKIRAAMADMEDTMPCQQIAVSFCATYTASDSVTANMGKVHNVIDNFKNSKAVQDFTSFKDNLGALHVLPWIFVVAMVFFTIFWLRGGVCCCCKGGTILGCLLLPYAILCLATLILNIVIGAVGLVLSSKRVQEDIKVSVLRGDPSMGEVIDHIKTNFSGFWSLVFQPFEEAGELMMNGAFVWVGICIVNFLFTLFVCCCRPCCLKPESKDSENTEQTSCPVPTGKARGFIQSLRAEYVQGQEASVGKFFESNADVESTLVGHEEGIRAAGNKEEAIRRLEASWGL